MIFNFRKTEEVIFGTSWRASLITPVPLRRQTNQRRRNAQAGLVPNIFTLLLRISMKLATFFLQLEMEQDDVIEVYQEQTGGCR